MLYFLYYATFLYCNSNSFRDVCTSSRPCGRYYSTNIVEEYRASDLRRSAGERRLDSQW